MGGTGPITSTELDLEMEYTAHKPLHEILEVLWIDALYTPRFCRYSVSTFPMNNNNRINGRYEFIRFQLEDQNHIVIRSLPWLSCCMVTVLSLLNDTMV